MKTHTLILTAPKVVIPKTENNIIEFVKELILSNLLNVECFSAEIDNQCDYMMRKWKLKIKTPHFYLSILKMMI